MHSEQLLQQQREQKGRRLRSQANALSVGRAVVGIGLGAYIAMTDDYHSFSLAGVTAANAYTDRLDGIKGRESDALLQIPAHPKNGMLDNLADKAKTLGFLVGKSVHHFARGEYGHAGFFVASASLHTIRDYMVTKKRRLAIEKNIVYEQFPEITPQIKTGATALGKAKTAEQLAVQVIDASPLGGTLAGEVVVIAGQLVSNALSVLSYRQTSHRIDSVIASNDALLKVT